MSLRNRVAAADWDFEFEEMLYFIITMQFLTFAVVALVLLESNDSVLVLLFGVLGVVGAAAMMYYGIKAHFNGVGWSDIQ